MGKPSKLSKPQHFTKQIASSNLFQNKSKSSLDLKHNKNELIDTRPQSVVVEKTKTISRSLTKHDLKLHKPGTIPQYLKANFKNKTQKIETNGFEKSVETGDFSEKVSDEIDLQSKINELTTKMEKLLEENKILIEKLNERSKLIENCECQIVDLKNKNNLLNVTINKMNENIVKKQDSNKKLKEKCKNFEEECKTSQEYLEAATKMSDKKVKNNALI